MAELKQRALANTPQDIVDASRTEETIPLMSRSGERFRLVSDVDLFMVESGPFETKRGAQKHGTGQGGRTT